MFNKIKNAALILETLDWNFFLFFISPFNNLVDNLLIILYASYKERGDMQTLP